MKTHQPSHEEPVPYENVPLQEREALACACASIPRVKKHIRDASRDHDKDVVTELANHVAEIIVEAGCEYCPTGPFLILPVVLDTVLLRSAAFENFDTSEIDFVTDVACDIVEALPTLAPDHLSLPAPQLSADFREINIDENARSDIRMRLLAVTAAFDEIHQAEVGADVPALLQPGFSKHLVDWAHEQGYDPTDQTQLNKAMDSFNALSFDERDAILSQQ